MFFTVQLDFIIFVDFLESYVSLNYSFTLNCKLIDTYVRYTFCQINNDVLSAYHIINIT